MTKPNTTKHFLSTSIAIKRAEVSLPTIIKWCRKYKIGVKVGGSWRIDPEKLERFLTGEVGRNNDKV